MRKNTEEDQGVTKREMEIACMLDIKCNKKPSKPHSIDFTSEEKGEKTY